MASATMSTATEKKTPRRLSAKKVGLWAVLLMFIALLWWVLVINTAIGEPTIVRGSLTERCLPQGKQNNIFLCTAKLSDGSTQLFKALRPLEVGASVSFRRYDRRLIGVSYEIQSF